MPTGDLLECGEAVGQSEGATVAEQVSQRTGPGYGWINTNTSEHTDQIMAAQSSDLCSNTPSLQFYSDFFSGHTFSTSSAMSLLYRSVEGKNRLTQFIALV